MAKIFWGTFETIISLILQSEVLHTLNFEIHKIREIKGGLNYTLFIFTGPYPQHMGSHLLVGSTSQVGFKQLLPIFIIIMMRRNSHRDDDDLHFLQ